eukprot:Trichotokara_eunicae@DN6833_c0_g1_i1.p1
MIDLQEKQATNYKEALLLFQQNYIKLLDGYYQEVEKQHLIEEQMRREWEKSKEVQDQFYERQMEFIEAQKLEAQQVTDNANAKRRVIELIYTKQLSMKHENAEGDAGNLTYSYAYPENVAHLGAPVSGGAGVPHKRRSLPIVKRR